MTTEEVPATLESATWLEHERGIVRVRMSREVVERFWLRTEDGRRVTVEWGEPDPEGFYDPVFTATDDGWRLVPADDLKVNGR